MVRFGFCAAVALGMVAASGASTQTPAPAPALAAAPAPPTDPCAPSQYASDTYFPKPAFPNQTMAPKTGPSRGFQVEAVAGGLEHPSSLAFLPDGRMLVAERPGRIRIVGKDGKLSAPLKGVPALEKVRLGGLHDVLLAPDFAKSRTLYLAFYTAVPGQVVEPGKMASVGVGRVARAKLSAAGDSLEDVVMLHEGGIVRRLNIAKDGTLLITSGSGGGPGPQSMQSDDGKVLRINTDGSIPKDNPWAGAKQGRPEIYALGFRDPEGATIDRKTGLLWTVEHGPRGGDELNVVRAGKNYGYATISYGREYSGALINNGVAVHPGMEQPVYFWGPDIAPSGLLIYTGSMFPSWKGNIFVGGLVGKRLVRLEMKGERVAAEEAMLTDRCQRIRDVRQGPEGAIYLLTDQDDGQVLRLVAKR